MWGNAALLRCVALALSPRTAPLPLGIGKSLPPFVPFVRAVRCAALPAGLPAPPAPPAGPAPIARPGFVTLLVTGRRSSGTAAGDVAALLSVLAPHAGQRGETPGTVCREAGRNPPGS